METRQISLSGATDCYQPVERKLQLTRRYLEVLARFQNPVVVLTKNALFERDIDHLSGLARPRAVAVYLSVTPLDPDLARILEPRASSPKARLKAIQTLSAADISAGVSAAPMIPGLNDSEPPATLETAAAHGASFAAYSTIRLPGAVAEVFEHLLDRHLPMAKEKMLGHIRAAHDGKLNGLTPSIRMRGTGAAANQTQALFHACCKRNKLSSSPPSLSIESFKHLTPGQRELF